jgi:hypothetical protein
MIILIRGIPHTAQRYDTQGDWWFAGEILHVRVNMELSQTEQWCIALHETVEAILCRHKYGSRATSVADKWDLSHKRAKEPGELRGCPYKREHTVASVVEKILELELMK